MAKAINTTNRVIVIGASAKAGSKPQYIRPNDKVTLPGNTEAFKAIEKVDARFVIFNDGEDATTNAAKTKTAEKVARKSKKTATEDGVENTVTEDVTE